VNRVDELTLFTFSDHIYRYCKPRRRRNYICVTRIMQLNVMYANIIQGDGKRSVEHLTQVAEANTAL